MFLLFCFVVYGLVPVKNADKRLGWNMVYLRWINSLSLPGLAQNHGSRANQADYDG